MCRTCLYAEDMSKMIQIRDVPEQMHGILKARAAREGMSLSDYLKRELEQIAERPSMREWLDTHTENKAGPLKTERRAGNPRIARRTMIVLDASVVVELLTNGVLADSIRRDLAGRNDSLITPHLLDVEVVSALRNLVAGRRIETHRSEEMLSALAALPAVRCAHTSLLGACGNCGTTLQLTMLPTSLWRRPPVQSCTPATRNCAKATVRGSCCSPTIAPDCGNMRME